MLWFKCVGQSNTVRFLVWARFMCAQAWIVPYLISILLGSAWKKGPPFSSPEHSSLVFLLINCTWVWGEHGWILSLISSVKRPNSSKVHIASSHGVMCYSNWTSWLTKWSTLILATAQRGHEKQLLWYPCGCSLTPEIQRRVVLNEVNPYMVTKHNGHNFSGMSSCSTVRFGSVAFWGQLDALRSLSHSWGFS